MIITKKKISSKTVKREFNRAKSLLRITNSDNEVANFIVGCISVLEKKIGDPKADGEVKSLYIRPNKTKSRSMPSIVYEIAEKYNKGKIDKTKAMEILHDAHNQYKEILLGMGYKIE